MQKIRPPRTARVIMFRWSVWTRYLAVLAGLQLALASSGWGAADELPSLDPRKRITQYIFDSWSTEDGLPSNQILAITQTRDGYLWLATPGGLVRFDGVSFTVVSAENPPEVRNEVFSALVEGPDGSLWIGSSGAGVFRYREGQFVRYTVEDGLGNSVTTLFFDRSGVLWVGSQGGLYRLDAEVLVRVPLDGSESVDGAGSEPVVVHALSEDAEGTIWIGTLSQQHNLLQLRDGVVRPVATSALQGLNAARALQADPDGALWVGTNRGLFHIEGDFVTSYGRDDGLLLDDIRYIYRGRNGSLWIGTDGGLNRFSDGTFESFSESDGLPDGRFRSIYEDREGNLWLGTYAGGLGRLKDGPITSYTVAEGLSDNVVWAVLEDSARNLWVGGEGGLDWLNDDGLEATRRGFPASAVLSMTVAGTGEFWAGTDQGLIRAGQAGFRLYTTQDGLSDDRVKVIYEDPDASGTLWIGTQSGLDRYRDGAITRQGSFRVTVYSVLRDRSGNLWVSTGAGLRRYRDQQVVVFTTADGLPSNSLRMLYEDDDSNLWIGTQGGGLARYRDGRFSSFTTREGLLTNDVWGIVEDDLGNLWLSSDNGIQRVARGDLDSLDAGHLASIPAKGFGLADGMENTECNGQGTPMGWKSADGAIWFPTMGGAARVDPNWTEPNLDPPVRIEALFAGGAPVDLGSKVVLEPDRRDLEIHYTALSYRNPQRVTFRYRLNALDRWQDVGTRRVAFYTNLPSDTYDFQVQARVDGGSWNDIGSSLEFSVKPYVHEQVGFRALCLLLAIALGYAGYLYRTQRIRARSQHLEAINQQLATANRRLEETNAELERYAYTVSHDLKNPLLTILGFTGSLRNDLERGVTKRMRADLGRVEAAATRMNRLLEELLELSRVGRVVNPSESIELRELMTEAAGQVQEAARERRVDMVIADDLPRVWGDRARLCEVFRNLIGNAIKFMGDQSSPRVEVGARRQGDEIICFVRDNGVGIASTYLSRVFGLFNRLDPSVEGTGIGLALVKQIVELHGGKVWAESAGAGQGATFYLTLPRSNE